MKNIAEEPFLTSATQTRRPQRVNPLPIHNSARILRSLLLESPQLPVIFVFRQPTASLSLAHPYMENPPAERERGIGLSFSFSSSAGWAGALNAAVRQLETRVGDSWREERGGGGGARWINNEDGCGSAPAARPLVCPSVSLKVGKMAVLLCQGCWEAAVTSASASSAAMRQSDAAQRGRRGRERPRHGPQQTLQREIWMKIGHLRFRVRIRLKYEKTV